MPPSNPAFRSVDPDTTPEVKNQYTQALIHNGIIYGSGTIPWNRERQLVGDNITDQAKQVLKNIEIVLKESGSSPGSILKLNCYLQDFKRDFPAFEQVLRQWFGEHRPARINLQNPQLPANALVEIDFIAAVEEKK